MSGSEVAALRQRIEEEIASMHRLMNGPAVVGRHEIIHHKMQKLGVYHHELKQLVGEEQAVEVLYQAHSLLEGDSHA